MLFPTASILIAIASAKVVVAQDAYEPTDIDLTPDDGKVAPPPEDYTDVTDDEVFATTTIMAVATNYIAAEPYKSYAYDPSPAPVAQQVQATTSGDISIIKGVSELISAVFVMIL
jgi:hypothetical protein